MQILEKTKLEDVLLAHWKEYINAQQLMRATLQLVRDAEYPEKQSLHTTDFMATGIKILITKISIVEKGLEIWVEFTVPFQNGATVGTHVFLSNMDETFDLKETYGTRFLI